MVKILGLKFNHTYEDTKQLRYGHLMIMTDQDHDGSHIKGTCLCLRRWLSTATAELGHTASRLSERFPVAACSAPLYVRRPNTPLPRSRCRFGTITTTASAAMSH